MKLAIMQPYFFPYLGYFQLIWASDNFLFHDDVCYIKQGWINRNRIIRKQRVEYITIPLRNASSSALIYERYKSLDDAGIKKIISQLWEAYRHTPNCDEILNMVNNSLTQAENIADVAIHSVLSVMGYLGVKRPVSRTSEKYPNTGLKAEEKVIHLCAKEGALTYINPCGGIDLYNDDAFSSRGIDLFFLKPQLPRYDQRLSDEFVPGLSIIDVLMNCSKAQVQEMLSMYDLYSKPVLRGMQND